MWAVVWRKISATSPLKIRLEPRTSEATSPTTTGQVRPGPPRAAGEIEDARTRLGEARRVVVNLEDPPLGREDPRVPILTTTQYAFPFPQRLVASVTPTAVEIYRWTEIQVAGPRARGPRTSRRGDRHG